MDVCCTVRTKDKIRDSNDKEAWIKYRAKIKKKSWWSRDFPHPSRQALEVLQWVPDLFLGAKSGRGVTLTTHIHLVPRLKKE